MAAPTETYIDPADGAANGNDHGGNAFVDGSFANATNTLTKVGAFTAATTQAGDKIYLDDNGSGEVTAGLYTIQTRTDNDNIVLTADIRSGAPDPTDVRCDQHTGAVGLPWATVQHALDFTTRDAANGDRFNVKAGTDDVLAAALDITTNYGTPTPTAPWILQGYTANAGDGGIGGISGGGAVGVFASGALDAVIIIDMHLHDCGAATVVLLDNQTLLQNVEVDNTSGNGISIDNQSRAEYCYVHNVGGLGIDVNLASSVLNCTVENGANDVSVGIRAGQASVIEGNVVVVDGASDGIQANSQLVSIRNNDVYSSAGTGQGIVVDGKAVSLLNNIVEGFSGVGGIGYDVNDDLALYGHNKAYNNTTNFDLLGGTEQYSDLGNNDVLLASPFANPGAGNFEVDTTVRAAGWPTTFKGIATDQFLDAGAAQREEADAAPGWW